MPKFVCLGIALALLSSSAFVWAEEDGSFTNYEAIIKDLKTSANETPLTVPTKDYDWEDVAIHAGAAVAGSWVAVNGPDQAGGSGLLKGIEVNFGINLFSKSVIAEGAYLNFAEENLNPQLKTDLKEFELRLVYCTRLQDDVHLRLGAGLAARYLTVDSYANSHWSTTQYTSPSSVFLLGVERKISKILTFGPEISYRAAIGSDTFDRSSVDGSLRLNATF